MSLAVYLQKDLLNQCERGRQGHIIGLSKNDFSSKKFIDLFVEMSNHMYVLSRNVKLEMYNGKLKVGLLPI